MPWINLKPKNSGGGRAPDAPTAKVYATGQLTLSHATTALLGTPAKVRVSYEPESQRIRITPTTPDDRGGFALAGGGNSPHRFSSRQMVTDHPQMLGEYRAVQITGGIELRKTED